MKNKQWYWKTSYIHLGFDKDEMWQVRVHFDMCVPHQYADIGFTFLGVWFDLGWFDLGWFGETPEEIK